MQHVMPFNFDLFLTCYRHLHILLQALSYMYSQTGDCGSWHGSKWTNQVLRELLCYKYTHLAPTLCWSGITCDHLFMVCGQVMFAICQDSPICKSPCESYIINLCELAISSLIIVYPFSICPWNLLWSSFAVDVFICVSKCRERKAM